MDNEQESVTVNKEQYPTLDNVKKLTEVLIDDCNQFIKKRGNNDMNDCINALSNTIISVCQCCDMSLGQFHQVCQHILDSYPQDKHRSDH